MDIRVIKLRMLLKAAIIFVPGMAYLTYGIPHSMKFTENNLYHIYNRGNNRQQIFFSDENYMYFLKKVRKFILPFCDIINYNLMPNHFHFIIHADERTVQNTLIGNQEKNVLSEALRNVLHTYTKGINKQNDWTGSLFQQNTRAKCLYDGDASYAPTCFHYVHQNAWKAGIVQKMEDWNFSSFPDYAGFRSDTICNKSLAFKLLEIDPVTFYFESYQLIQESSIKFIF